MRSTRRSWIGCDLLIHRKNYKSRWASHHDLPIGFIIDYGIAACEITRHPHTGYRHTHKFSDNTMIAYYVANRPEDGDWVMLPVTNFNYYFGDTNFGRKYLNILPAEVVARSNSFGISRYRVLAEYLP